MDSSGRRRHPDADLPAVLPVAVKLEFHLHIWVHEVPNDETIVALTQVKEQGEAILDAVQDIFDRFKAQAAEELVPVISPLDEKP